MALNVLWRSSVGAAYIGEHQTLLADDIHLTVETDKAAAKRKLGGVHVLVDGSPDPDMLDGDSLAHVIVPYVGINDALRSAILERPRLTLYNSHFNDAFVAQHAVALLLACSNRIPAADAALRQGNWSPDGLESLRLDGKTCLLLGYGAIGREIAARIQGFGVSLSALRRQPEEGPIRQYGPGELLTALAEADVIMVSLPATPDTKGLLDRDAFAAMKAGVIIVNVGRGEVIDQHALYDALVSGKVAGAGLDVWWHYPETKEARSHTFPSDAPLHELGSVVMSPHRAAHYRDWGLASFKDVAKTLNAIARGEARNRTDPKQGY